MYPAQNSVQYNYGQPQPVVMQPGYAPPFVQQSDLLQPFYGIDKIIVKQKKEMLEIFSGWETNNRYEIYNGAGQQILYAFEDTSAISLLCFGESRPFCLRVIDSRKQQIIVVNSSIACCTRNVTIEVPPGNLAANVRQEFAFFTPSFYASNPAGQLLFKVTSRARAVLGSFGDVTFDVYSSDQRTIIGQITKQWSGFFREWMTDADTFGLSVPADMDITWKAILLGVLFVIDFQFYEKSHRNRQH